MILISIHQNFAWSWTGVISRAHRKTIGTSTEDGQQISFFYLWQCPISGKSVTALANRTYDINQFHTFLYRCFIRIFYFWHFYICIYRPYPVKGIVKGWSNQIIHSGVTDNKLLPVHCLLCINHLRNQGPGIPNDKSSRLHNQIAL